MQIKGNNIQQARLTIRVSRNTLSFSVVDREAEHQLIYEPYTVKSGVSMAANLRQAFKESTLLQRGYQKVRVYLDSPILLVPMKNFMKRISMCSISMPSTAITAMPFSTECSRN